MLIDDLSTITTIPKDVLIKLVKKAQICVSDSLVEQSLANQEIFEIDISVGKILLKLYDDDLKFKFIPNDEFKQQCYNAIVNKENLLSKTVEKSLVTKITKVYKDLL